MKKAKIMKKVLLLSLSVLISNTVYSQELYQANWSSLAKHNAEPEWLKDAKLGIYFHWGPYSVPAYGNEWYPSRMHNPKDELFEYHKKTYGDVSKFGYHDFIPQFTGQHFNPEDWAQLFKNAGAKFAGPVAEHHDGFSMWDSALTPWNAKDMGPKRDILGDLFNALEQQNLKTIATFHHSKNLASVKGHHYRQSKHTPKNWPTVSNDKKLQHLYGNLDEQYFFETIWLGKLKEVINQYQPDIVWFDSWLDRIPENYRQRFAAYYLNKAQQWDKDVVIVRKQEDLPLNFSILDFEQSRSSKALTQLWMTDDTINAGKSWSFTHDLNLKPVSRIIHGIIDTTAKNGVTLFNISPRADGVIPDDQRQILLNMGKWLKHNGEAIYATRPWQIAAEGPTIEPEGGYKARNTFLAMDYTAKDIRFTRNKNNDILYVIALGWPENGQLQVTSLANLDISLLESIQLLGSEKPLHYQATSEGLIITLSDKPNYGIAYPIKLTFKHAIPTNKENK